MSTHFQYTSQLDRIAKALERIAQIMEQEQTPQFDVGPIDPREARGIEAPSLRDMIQKRGGW